MKPAFLITLVLALRFCCSAQTDTSSLRSIIDKKITTGSFSGTVLIAQHGQPILQVSSGFKGFGSRLPITNDTRFSIASITKMLTAIVILELTEEGKLQLSDRISSILPEYIFPGPDSITIHHLLLHISGLPNEPDSIYKTVVNEGTYIKTVLATGKPNVFGQFNYNNVDYVLLGLVIKKKLGKNWERVIRERLIDKLKLSNTGFLHKGKFPRDFAEGYLVKDGKPVKEDAFYIDNFFAAGSMYSTAADILAIDQAMYGSALLNEDSKKLMYTSYPQYNYTGYSVWTYKYPFAKTQPRIMERRGGIFGSNSVLVRFLDTNQTIIIVSNNDAFNPDSFGDKDNLREALIMELSK